MVKTKSAWGAMTWLTVSKSAGFPDALSQAGEIQHFKHLFPGAGRDQGRGR